VISVRLYREAFAPALVAVVLLLFSLQGRPGPLPSVVASAEFDQRAAAKLDRQIVSAAPSRTPGSEGDAAIAAMVERHFAGVREGEVTEQRFDGSFEGDDVELRNLILTLPGESPRSVVVMAARDSASGPGAASSAAATAALLELLDKLRTARHTKTLVFVSTDGGSDGATGAREFAKHFPGRDLIDGAVVLWQPGGAISGEPSLLDSSAGPQSPSAQLVHTAEQALADQAGRRPPLERPFGELSRLALPSGLGEQAVLVQEGIDAVGLSSAGERPLPVAADQPDDLSEDALGDLGRTALLLVATLDENIEPPEHGPDAYLNLAGNLVPGWALALLALTLLLPAALTSLDALWRARRAGARVGRALAWSASRALPLLAALLLLYLLALTGIVARPTFPFDPGRFRVGAGQILAVALLGAVAFATYYEMRRWPLGSETRVEVARPALGAVSAAAVAFAWLANPYLALLTVPLAHVWLVGSRRGEGLAWPLIAAAIALAVLPLVTAIAQVCDRLDLGITAPWQLALMVGDGQIGFVPVVALCVLAGCMAGLLAIALRSRPLLAAPRSAPPGPSTMSLDAQRHPVGSAARRHVDASPIPSRAPADDLGGEG
jgi:hypothetical protein